MLNSRCYDSDTNGTDDVIQPRQIDRRVAEMAKEISANLPAPSDRPLRAQGAMFFCADLVRQMDMDVALDFIQISSYGNQKYSSGS